MQNSPMLEQELSHEMLFAEHYEWLQRWALQLNDGKHSDAEDLVHDLFIQLMRLRPRIDSDIDRARGYLYKMLRNMYLSKVRRAQRDPICELTVIDYDSFDLGMRSVPERSLPAVSIQLWQICEYMCEWKWRSRAASVLILRFFLGYFPGEIARILHASRALVDKYLHTARREARTVATRPVVRPIFGERHHISQFPHLPEDSGELFFALRSRVFRSCAGQCLSPELLAGVYGPAPARSLETSELAHLVSCPECLDRLNNMLGIRCLSERCPSRALGRDGGPPWSSSQGGSSENSSFEQTQRDALLRLEEENEHRPAYLQVAVNGEVRTSKKVTAELTELLLSLDVDVSPEFVEIFSEQDVRLLYLPIESESRSGDAHASVRLSDRRTLDLSVSLTLETPAVYVRYSDPLFLEGQEVGEALNPEISAHPERTTDSWVLRACRACTSGWWLGPALATTVLVLVVSGVLLRLHRSPFRTPEELLDKANRTAATAAPQFDCVRRTIQIEQMGGSGEGRSSVIEWTSADASNRARRLYDSQGKLVAEEITRGADTRFYGGAAQRTTRKLDPAHMRSEDVWQITLSTAQFQALIAPASPSAMRQEGDDYAIQYRHPADDQREGLIEATLVIRRGDLHPVEEDLVLRDNGELHHFRLIESSYDHYASAKMQQDVFAPDQELSPDVDDTSAGEPLPGLAGPSVVNPDLVMRALYLLSQAGADMNGETSVKISKDRLVIAGTVASGERRNEILHVLDPLHGKSGVVIRLLTADQIQARLQNQRSKSMVEVIQPAGGAIPLDRQGRQLLSRQGIAPQQMNEAMEHFSQQAVANADEVQQHAWALHQIATRFTSAELNSLAPEARREWISVVDLHASALLRSVEATQSMLAGLAPNGQNVAPLPESITDLDQFSRDANQMLILAQSCDRDIASALTLSAAPVGNQPLLEANFWRSLNLLQSLAHQTVATDHALESAAKNLPLISSTREGGSSRQRNR